MPLLPALPLPWAGGIGGQVLSEFSCWQSESTDRHNARHRLSLNLLSGLKFLAGLSWQLLPDLDTTPRPAGIHSAGVPGLTLPLGTRGGRKGGSGTQDGPARTGSRGLDALAARTAGPEPGPRGRAGVTAPI